MKIYTKCMDYAGEACPCVLAESGHCIVCSMCAGKNFCECSDTVSFCVLQELKNNGGQAKPPRPVLRSEVVYEKTIDGSIKLLRLKIQDREAGDFRKNGSFVFVRVKDNPFYDVPISVMYEEINHDSIQLLIEIRGVKTKCFKDLRKGDTVYLRGPYFNGIQGAHALSTTQDSEALVICRGIGLFPSLHAIAELRSNNNRVTVCLDSGTFNQTLLKIMRDLYEFSVVELSVYDEKGNISKEVYKVIDEALKRRVGIIHLGLSDYVMKRMIGYVADKGNGDTRLSAINNARMCCGEGICGACTVSSDSREIIHLCKTQMDVADYGKLL